MPIVDYFFSGAPSPPSLLAQELINICRKYLEKKSRKLLSFTFLSKSLKSFDKFLVPGIVGV